jgi:hypothetical protein
MKITFVAAILLLFTPAYKVDLFHSENGLSCDVCLPAVTISKQPSKTAPQVTFNINKSIELQGPQLHVDPHPSQFIMQVLPNQ